MSKYLDPKYDLTFRKVFGEHKNLVKSLLNALLPLPNEKSIEDLEYLDASQIPDNPAKKYSIVDVKCKDNSGRYFIVEMQMYWNSAFFMRTLYNTTKVYSSQLQKADSFNELKNVYALSIVNDNAFPKFKNEYIQEYYIINKKHPTDDIREDIALVFVELPKYKPVEKSEKLLKDLWMQFLTEINESTTEIDEDLLNNSDTAEALGIMERSAYSEADLAAYEKQKLDEITERSVRNNLLEKGREKGKEEGREEGREEERAKAYQEKLSMARQMKSDGMPIDVIVKYSGLSKDEIEKL